jgi:malate dehydrogenase
MADGLCLSRSRLDFAMYSPIRVAVTGAAGQIGYALVFRIACGEVFGARQPVILHLIEVPPVMPALSGVEMELEDCAFATLAGVLKADSDHLEEGFRNCNFVLCVGSVPRKEGMERGDLIRVNGPIFTSTGKAIQSAAAKDVRVLVVGNPCNTNCLIAMHNAPDVPRDRWFAMTRLDQNRAASLLARKAGAPVETVQNLGIWGNHSATQFPDFYHATISGVPVPTMIRDEAWLKGPFIEAVQKRGAAVIKARGARHAQEHHQSDGQGGLLQRGGVQRRLVQRRQGADLRVPADDRRAGVVDRARPDAQRLRPREDRPHAGRAAQRAGCDQGFAAGVKTGKLAWQLAPPIGGRRPLRGLVPPTGEPGGRP